MNNTLNNTKTSPINQSSNQPVDQPGDQSSNQPASEAKDLSVDYQTTKRLTHLNDVGDAHMVDVGYKDVTYRRAIAEGFITMHPETLELIVSGTAKKGDVLATARIAGIMAAKKTSDLIPLCHPLMLTSIEVELIPVFPDSLQETDVNSISQCGIQVQATTALSGKTGVEMEALTAVSVACLTLYDMCKAVDRGMEIGQIRLVRKEGGKSGVWQRA